MNMRERLADERGFLLRTALTLLIFLAVAAIAVSDSGQIIVAKFKVASAAQAAAEDAAFEYKNSHDMQVARQAAEADVATSGGGARIKDFEINQDTGEVTVTVVRNVPTIAVKYIGFLKGFEKAESTHTAQPPTE